ncbi:MAG TPA: PAS domain-containing protein [Saprospiraceae bacterium]|nr:PAS domain-containing protein [Saprospiraceae bacterium]
MSLPIEIILNRQLADSMAIPVFITDTVGNLLFYNEPAEEILGKRFEETGELTVEQWGTMFKNKDMDGRTLEPDELPLVKTLLNQLPYFKTFWIESLQGKLEKISVTSYPIIGRSGNFVGGVAIFWRPSEE